MRGQWILLCVQLVPFKTNERNDVPRGTMNDVSSHIRLDPPFSDGKAAAKIAPPRPRIPWWKGLGADSEEKREPVSDIDAAADSLKVLDPNWPIREADINSVARLATHQPSDFVKS